MVVKPTPGGAGSAGGLVNYLEKQETGKWFNQSREQIGPLEVTNSLDSNKKNLGKDDDKFYQIIISPSQKELNHIGNDPEKLREYTRTIMEGYAQNFNKGISSQDLVWFAKIEQERNYNYRDKTVQNKETTKEKSKEGAQTHVHILVSRTEDLQRYKELKQAKEIDRKNPLKLSPLTHHRSTEQGAVKGGFDRSAFKETAEKAFDQQFKYERALSETFHYANTMQKGNQEERIQLRHQVIKEELNKTRGLSVNLEPKKENRRDKDPQELSL